MTLIAADMEDSAERLAERVAAQRTKPGFALDAYFYRSPRVYRKELDEILYKSWLYAGHVSQIPNPGELLPLRLRGGLHHPGPQPRPRGACADERLPASGRPGLRGRRGPSGNVRLPLPRLDLQPGRQPQGGAGDGGESRIRLRPATA